MSHMRQLLSEIKQTGCKTVAKAWIKAICPQKQAKWPYKCRKYKEGQVVKAPFWPENVPYNEPDHLDKAGKERSSSHLIGHSHS